MSYQAKIIAGGKISLPAELRRALDLKDGDTIMLDHDGTSFTGMSYETKIRKIQALFAPYRTPGILASDELIAERRAEAAREDAREDAPEDASE